MQDIDLLWCNQCTQTQGLCRVLPKEALASLAFDVVSVVDGIDVANHSPPFWTLLHYYYQLFLSPGPQLLQYKPTQRLPLRETLQHPWILRNADISRIPASPTTNPVSVTTASKHTS